MQAIRKEVYMPEQQYLEMMRQSLVKKKQMLDQLVLLTSEQAVIIQEKELNKDEFSRNVELKSEIIEQIDKLDEGFDLLYTRVKEELHNNRQFYRQEILELQKLISEVTDRSMVIQAAEQRNKQKIEAHFSLLHKNVKETKISNKAAASYYKNMSNTHVVAPTNIDIRSKNLKKR